MPPPGAGRGHGPVSAAVVDACVEILTNTVGRPVFSDVNGQRTPTVPASYGLYVDPAGLLQSPADADAPTRQVNTLLAPGGFVGTWLRDNGAAHTLAALYRSAYTVEAAYGFAAQQISGAAQLVTTTEAGGGAVVGMSMAPPLWIVNFALIYVLDPPPWPRPSRPTRPGRCPSPMWRRTSPEPDPATRPGTRCDGDDARLRRGRGAARLPP